MNLSDYNIEFAHIYADQNFDSEQIESIEVLKKTIAKLIHQKKSFSTSVLIDDYNPQCRNLRENNFINVIKSYNIPLDFLAYESQLSLISDRVVDDLPKSSLRIKHADDADRRMLVLESDNGDITLRHYYESYSKNTCALLTACWLLCRLGVYSIPHTAIKNLTTNPFQGKKIITILPKKYEKNENKALEIIRILGKVNILEDIKYVFF